MIPTGAFPNQNLGANISSQSTDKIVDLACDNPMLAAGVGCVAAGIAVLALTKGAALPIVAPMIALGTSLISTYFAGKSAAFLATEIAKPVIATVASGLMSIGQAAVNALTSNPLTSSRDALKSAILDSDETKPVADTDAPETDPSPDHEPPSLG
jgi:hypothetical protein